MAPKMKVKKWRRFFFFGRHVLFVVFGQIRKNLGKLEWNLGKNWCLKFLAPSEVVLSLFWEVIFSGFFSGKFAEIRAKILRTPKNLPAPSPMFNVTEKR